MSDERREEELTVALGSRKAREYLRSLREREQHLDKVIRGQEAISPNASPPSLHWQRTERAALRWVLGQLEPLDAEARAAKEQTA